MKINRTILAALVASLLAGCGASVTAPAAGDEAGAQLKQHVDNPAQTPMRP